MTGMTISSGVVLKSEYLQRESGVVVTMNNVSRGIGFSTSNALSHDNNAQGSVRDTEQSSQLLNNVLEMFTRFFTQLQSLLSDKGANVARDTTPVPQPRVVPKPDTPMPDPQATHLPDLSSKRGGAKADDIWGGFRQGPDGNCVTVSAIKAAMAKFGQSPTDIYKEVKKIAEGYRVTMRDGFALTLSRQELAEGIRGAKFVGRDKQMLKDAHFLFAVSAKRAQMENNDGTAKRSFSAAVRSLNDGEDERGAGEGFLRLGLKSHMKKVPVSTLAKGTLGMVNRTGHSVAVINGIEELYGKKGGAPRRGDAIALV
ncbi:hypothetical protein [Pseudomonas sp. PAMC 25886]|jgi:hypothetical protein|uniref:hypothetical protein n=1 Tax=Pseudomonas sp. PAMC 25886 TaxID=1125977 RepID=UPI000289ECDA|nr:hypothetical protein [Pseudomonas sp. PAMC 25886]